jgi:hypothetical protein
MARGNRRLPAANPSVAPGLTVVKYAGAYGKDRRYRRILKAVLSEPNPTDAKDAAMIPPGLDDEESLELYTATASARQSVRRRRAVTADRAFAHTRPASNTLDVDSGDLSDSVAGPSVHAR